MWVGVSYNPPTLHTDYIGVENASTCLRIWVLIVRCSFCFHGYSFAFNPVVNK